MSYLDNLRAVTPYVPGEQPKAANIIKLNTNENPYPPAPGVAKILGEIGGDENRKYPDPTVGRLTEALAKRYGVKNSQVFVGVGSDDVLGMCFLTFFNSSKPILFPNITYSFYPVWAELFRIPFETVALRDDFTIETKDYLKENGGIVIANPNAPTGIAMSLSEVETIVAGNPDSIVIIDEAYVDFGGESSRVLLDKYPNLVVVQTFSKSRSLAGMRIGFAIASEELISALQSVKYSYNSYTMNQASILAGTASVEDEAYFVDTCKKIVKTREWAKEEFAKMQFTCTDSSTNFLFVSHASVPAKKIFDELRARNIFVRYFALPKIDNYLRVTVGTDEEMEKLFAALKEILAAC